MDSDALLVFNHGIVTATPDVQNAVIGAVLLEKPSTSRAHPRIRGPSEKAL
jgi:hypothetical protein